ncbi:hypothetical protein VKT23_002667, partial [Stygiomarasmius scandens]
TFGPVPRDEAGIFTDEFSEGGFYFAEGRNEIRTRSGKMPAWTASCDTAHCNCGTRDPGSLPLDLAALNPLLRGIL